MLAELEPKLLTTSAQRSLKNLLILTETKQTLWIILGLEMPLASLTCMAMSGNGVKTTGTAATKVHRKMEVHGEPKMNQLIECFAAALGTTIRGIAAPLIATTSAAAAATVSVFVLFAPRRGLFNSAFPSSPFALFPRFFGFLDL